MSEFANVVDLAGVPESAQPPGFNPVSVFSDLGAWHAYALSPGPGGFTGPLYVAEEYPWWLSECFTRIAVTDAETGEAVPLTVESNEYLPGTLTQVCTGPGVHLTLRLWFSSARSATVTAVLSNPTLEARRLRVSWHGKLFGHEHAPALEPTERGVRAVFGDVREPASFLSTSDAQFEVIHNRPVTTTVTGGEYETTLDEEVVLARRSAFPIRWAERYTFTAAERARPVDDADPKDRWQGYLDRVLAGVAAGHRRLAVKCLVTLVTNWRSPAGALRRDGVTPSLSCSVFNGFWAWDSWKHAVGVAVFDPALGASIVESMFDHQREDGMVPDAVFYNRAGENWNERNTKPPLAAWAVWEVYQAGGDLAFLRRLYPRLASYHQWWYDHRAAGDGLCAYGATVDPANDTAPAVVQAAAWESGMDNAPRFDAAVPHDGYVLSQQSVCLNAYLVAEKSYLTLIAREIGVSDVYLPTPAAGLIRERMYDPATGWFYDALDGKPLTAPGKGIEGVIPLWAGIATSSQAAGVLAGLQAEFATHVPFPTVAAGSPHFTVDGYWRGPVWLDQAYFALEGLRRSGYASEAALFLDQLLRNADGLLGDAPIHENYQPLTGARLCSPNFSWSAAALLLLLR
ncbi:MGH1-like glycoside hydrolase domain-containing protein [Longispora albida]|uniref:MGH1-like glycoside hydrolase domain-containing protein n=1 Tax=Longispora albida TaxID=203523 RepID=UPI00037F89DA|nr:hypothetical protein [Longispora albida]